MKNQILKIFGLDITGPEKHHFSLFHFDDFLTTFAKDLMKKLHVFIQVSKVLRTCYIFKKIWDLEIFDNEWSYGCGFWHIFKD